MNAWKPGQRAMVEVEVEEVWPAGDLLIRLDGAHLVVPTADLLPASAPDADTIERAREVMWNATCADGLRAAMRPDLKVMAEALAAAGLLAAREPGCSEAERGAVHSSHTIKTIGEALSYAECALLNFYPDNSQRAMYARVIADLLADVKRQRPTGPDGKHGNRHTATCGCDDHRAAQVTGTEGGE